MKRFIINIILFGCSFILLFNILEYLFKITTPSEDRYKWQYEELFYPTVNADIVIMGTSKSVRGINPKSLEDSNISAFNFGLNGSNPEFIYKWYENYFKKYYPKPKLVLFEVNWQMFNENWMWRDIEQDSRYFPFKEYLTKILYSQDDKITTFFNRYYMFNRTIGEGGIMDSTYNGFTPHPFNLEDFKPMPDSVSFNPKKQKKFFDLILETFKKDNLNVIFVMLPERINHESPSYSIVKENVDYIEEKISEYIYLDYQDEFNNDSLFNDWGHLNINGAKIISEKIRRDIKARTHNSVYSAFGE